MIIRSAFRRAGGLGRHLLRRDTNEWVEVRSDLIRSAPGDLKDALAVFTAIARTNVRAKRDLIHIKVSPDHLLTDDELSRTLAAIEEEHRIPSTMPRYIIAHLKGDRAQHFHVVYPLVDPATGRAIRSHDNYLRDEIVSRRLELVFGERVIPGPRQAQVVEELAQRGMDDAVRTLNGGAEVEPAQRLGGATRQQAERLGVDIKSVSKSIYEIWIKARKDWTMFEERLDARGFSIAHGDKAIMIVERETGFHAPLGRLLRQAAKAADMPIKLSERELSGAFPKAKPHKKVRDDGLHRALGEARAAVDREFGNMILEAEADREEQLATKLQKVREQAKEQLLTEFRVTLKARREEIRALYRRRDRIRRARVNRAFIAARWFGNPRARRDAFLLAGTAVLLAGGGLGLAFLMAGMAVSILPNYERARALAYRAKQERQEDWTKLKRELDKAYHALRKQMPKPMTSIGFERIEKRHRIVAGALARKALESASGQSIKQRDINIYRRVLGADLACDIENSVIHGSGRAAITIMGWYRADDPRHQAALNAAVQGASAATTIENGKKKGAGRDRHTAKAARRPKPVFDKGWER